ncbi:MAG: bifunctional [glutamine synthetase] adenylyltransferase/[glutamine synthetase]-adenylyl-L-tyrosine phosphorylase [Novosphingobium sp.]|nr:bifunctional [glutamine synthetase] adenylyltransferase/[glutamine synthetase]-adenylyl-L-tyrosine phosphorylase [Novosphingobium sp.]
MTTAADADWAGALSRARAHSPFLSNALERLPDLADILADGRAEDALAFARAAGGDVAPGAGDTAAVHRALRQERLATALALGICDLSGAFPVARVTGELSAFADRALDHAIAAAICDRVPDAEPQGFSALALGKHGAQELNYSSDIDPILLYDPGRLPRRERDEPGEAAQRVARKIVELLGRVDGDGYVFRVDLRLRPASEVSPLAVSFNAALTHYESSALAWERAAFIRARAAAGDIAEGQAFLDAIRPFVWRKSLDFGAIVEIGRLTSRIRNHYDGPKRPGQGFDLKRGRGGIREVEFFAQTHQLIHGGRNPALRQRGTRATLDALAEAGLIGTDDARILGDSYDRLRVAEHRLQMVADHQTHSLPVDPAALDNVARLAGFADSAAFVEDIAEVTEEVGVRFDALLDQMHEGAGDSGPGASATPSASNLDKLGFSDAETLAARMESWFDGRVRALRSDAARSAFEALAPQLLEALAAAPDPDAAFLRWEMLLGNLPTGVNLFRLLQARPGLLDQLVNVLVLAPPLAEELARRSDLLDQLIDASAFDLPGEVDDLAARMAWRETGDDYEATLDRIRRVVGETRFALGVQLIEAAHDPIAIAQALARTAEAAVQVAARAATQEFELVHGRIAGSELIILGLGRFGGGALTHASDLDIIYLFSGESGAESDGHRPLGATHYFNRLAQRVSAALSVPTAEGGLYEVDTRLRPQGAQGPLAVSIDSFARYQRESAWTWEHMALTRARALYGPDKARQELGGIISEVLSTPRDPAQLAKDVLKMRAEMATHKPRKGALDAKLARGGLVDLEFVVHFLQLRDRVAFSADLGDAVRALGDAGLVARDLAHAHDFMTRLLVASRLLAPDLAMPGAAAAGVLARACGCENIDALLQTFAEARQEVAKAWQAAFNIKLEIDDE